MRNFKRNNNIDALSTLLPVFLIALLFCFFCIFPEASNDTLMFLRHKLNSMFKNYYMLIGIVCFLSTLFVILSKFGNIRLGNTAKPEHSTLSWGAMMFTCGLAADILFYSFSEQFMYIADLNLENLSSNQPLSGTLSLFHWGFIPWSFYLILAISFGYMLHNKNVFRQRFSEATRTLLHNWSDRWPGKLINLIAVFSLVAATTTTFAIATPLMSQLIFKIFNINLNEQVITISLLFFICFIYTVTLLKQIKGIKILSNICFFLFICILLFIIILSDNTFAIWNSSIIAFKNMLIKFPKLSTFSYIITNSHVSSSLYENWTVYYWSYWIVWCIATPFFVGKISKGRTLRQVIIGGYFFGAGSTMMSFAVLGNYPLTLSLNQQNHLKHLYMTTLDPYKLILDILDTLPYSNFIMILILFTMILFYATSFNSIAYIASCYSYNQLQPKESPSKLIELLWCLLLIIFPIALVISKSPITSLQSISIIMALPLSLIFIVIIIGFFLQSRKDFYNVHTNKF